MLVSDPYALLTYYLNWNWFVSFISCPGFIFINRFLFFFSCCSCYSSLISGSDLAPPHRVFGSSDHCPNQHLRRESGTYGNAGTPHLKSTCSAKLLNNHRLHSILTQFNSVMNRRPAFIHPTQQRCWVISADRVSR